MTKNDNDNIFQKLIEFEDKNDLLKYRFCESGIMMWPYVRFLIFSKIVLQELSGSDQHSGATKIEAKKILKNFRYFCDVIQDTRKPLFQRDILFLSSSIYNTDIIESKYYNWLYDPYASIYKDHTYMLERSHNLELKRPRYNENVKSYDSGIIKIRIEAKFAKVKQADVNSINELIELISLNSPYEISEETSSAIRKRLVRMSKEIKYQLSYWKGIFNIIKPKVIFIDDGSYGGWSHIYEEAHKRNIICCEFQHGLVHKEAYYFGNKIINSKVYKNYLPDYYLTFGEFWSKLLVSSSKAITVGNPKIQLYKAEKRTSGAKPRVLFISTIYIADRVMNLVKDLLESGAENKYSFIIRPHPNDFSIYDRYIMFGKEYNINIQFNQPITEALHNADAIVAEASTVIYEALANNLDVYI